MYREKKTQLSAWRRVTAPMRMLPSFAIVSVERGGTTSLYRWLCQHPCVAQAVRKEVHYFDMNFSRGERWYRAHFPLRAEAALHRVLRRRPFVAAEASPYYLYHPHVPARLSRVLPHARFVALVRNPVDRAWSHYHMNRRQGEEAFSFEDAIAREGERLAGEEERLRSDEGYWSHSHYRYGYLARGLYAERLEEWGKRFGPERLLVVSSEELYTDPPGALARVVAWLGLPAWSPGELQAYNQKPYPGLDPDTRRRLADFFAPHNQRLYALLGRDLGWS